MTRRLPLLVAALFAVLLFFLGWMVGRPGAAPKLVPLTCYPILGGAVDKVKVTLTTQFNTTTTEIVRMSRLCLPTEKKLLGDRQPKPVARGEHLVCYEINFEGHKTFKVQLTDQFALRQAKVVSPGHEELCEPADKTLLANPGGGGG